MMGVFLYVLWSDTLQPINYLLHIDNSAFSGFIKYNRHFTPFCIEDAQSNPFISAAKGGILNENWCKGANIQRKMKPIIYDGFVEVF